MNPTVAKFLERALIVAVISVLGFVADQANTLGPYGVAVGSAASMLLLVVGKLAGSPSAPKVVASALLDGPPASAAPQAEAGIELSRAYLPVAGGVFRLAGDHGEDLADSGRIFTDPRGLSPEAFAAFTDGAQFGDVLRHLHDFPRPFVTFIRRPIAERVAHAMDLIDRAGYVRPCGKEEDPDGKFARLTVGAIGQDSDELFPA